MSKVKANELESITGLSSVLVKDLVKQLPSSWVSIDALTGNIFESFNVSNVVRNGVGDFTIFFATPMDTANYGVMSNGRNVTSLASTPQDVNSVRIVEYNSSGTSVNGTIVTVATFGGKTYE